MREHLILSSHSSPALAERVATTDYSHSSKMSEQASVYIRVARVRMSVTQFLCVAAKIPSVAAAKLTHCLDELLLNSLGLSVVIHPKPRPSFH